MTSLFERLHRRASAVGLALLLLLAGCGPGTGGTGTGPSTVFGFSGSSASVAAPGLGTSCPPGCQQADLRLQEGRIELVVDCRRFVFTGAWDPSAQASLVLGGVLEAPTGSAGAGQPATLRLQFSGRLDETGQVNAVVVDAAGRPLLGPLVLQRSAATVAPACGV